MKKRTDIDDTEISHSLPRPVIGCVVTGNGKKTKQPLAFTFRQFLGTRIREVKSMQQTSMTSTSVVVDVDH